jgi:hypothetical protein
MAKCAFLSALVMALTKLGDLPRWLAFSFSSRVRSEAFGNRDSSSRIARIPARSMLFSSVKTIILRNTKFREIEQAVYLVSIFRESKWQTNSSMFRKTNVMLKIRNNTKRLLWD